MQSGSSELVREVALERYIHPALTSGRKRFSIMVKDLMKDLRPRGFPAANYAQICSSIKEKGFVRRNGLRIVSIDGPPSGQSSTVVVHYEIAGSALDAAPKNDAPVSADKGSAPAETSSARALRLMEGLRGLLKGEYKEYGGGEAFLKWVRSEDDHEVSVGTDK